jgi:hypothetical protein
LTDVDFGTPLADSLCLPSPTLSCYSRLSHNNNNAAHSARRTAHLTRMTRTTRGAHGVPGSVLGWVAVRPLDCS